MVFRDPAVCGQCAAADEALDVQVLVEVSYTQPARLINRELIPEIRTAGYVCFQRQYGLRNRPEIAKRQRHRGQA